MALNLVLVPQRQSAKGMSLNWGPMEGVAAYQIFVGQKKMSPEELEAAQLLGGTEECIVAKVGSEVHSVVDDLTPQGEPRYYGVAMVFDDGSIKAARFRAVPDGGTAESFALSALGDKAAAPAAPRRPAAAAPAAAPAPAAPAPRPAAAAPAPRPAAAAPAPAPRPAAAAPAPAPRSAAAAPAPAAPAFAPAPAAPAPAAEEDPLEARKRAQREARARSEAAAAVAPAPAPAAAAQPAQAAPAAPPPATPPPAEEDPLEARKRAQREARARAEEAAAAPAAQSPAEEPAAEDPLEARKRAQAAARAGREGGADAASASAEPPPPPSAVPLEGTLELKMSGGTQTWDGLRIHWEREPRAAAYEIIASDHQIFGDEVADALAGKADFTSATAVAPAVTCVIDNVTARESRGWFAVLVRFQDGKREAHPFQVGDAAISGRPAGPFINPNRTGEVRAEAEDLIAQAQEQWERWKNEQDGGARREAKRMVQDALLIFPGHPTAKKLAEEFA